MTTLFYGYSLSSRKNVSQLLSDHMKRFSSPPTILVANKFDSESIGKDLTIPVIFERWVLPSHIYAGIEEQDEKA